MKPSSQRRIAAAFAWLIAAFWMLTHAPPSRAAAGLVGTYYNNSTLTAPPVLVRTDATVNFNYGNGSPDAAVNADYFSVRWTGVVRVATTGNYTFQTASDDGVRLYVNNVLVINDWNVHATTVNTSAAISLTAGIDYPVKLEFFEAYGSANVTLSWLKPGDSAYSIVPASDGTQGLATGTAPMLEYLFEEASWNGTSGEVLDTSGNLWHGTAASLSATADDDGDDAPATGSSAAGTCRYGVFNRGNKDYPALPSVFPNLGASGGFTVTAWIRTTNNALVGQRIFIDDENGYAGSNYGYVLSLGDAGAGKLHYFTRMTPSNGSLDTGAVIANNTWYFVAFGVDLSTKTKFLYVYDAAGTQLAAVSNTFTEANLGSDPGIASIGGETNNAGGSENTSGYGFGGNLDEVRVYPFALTSAEIATVRGLVHSCTAAALVAQYHFEDASYTGATNELTDSAGASGGPYHGNATGSPLPTISAAAPAISGTTTGTCGYASLPGPWSNGGAFIVPTLPTSGATQVTVAFWMYWDSSIDNVIPVSFYNYTLWLYNGGFGFNTGNTDLYGISNAPLANGWHHVVAVFTNGSLASNHLYIDGTEQVLTQRIGSTPAAGSVQLIAPLRFGGYNKGGTDFRFKGRLDEMRIYSGALTAAQAQALATLTHTCAATLDHVEVRHASGTGLTCTPSTVTIAACRDAACSTAHTDGVSGTLTAAGSGMTVNWPAGASFTIPSGSSTTTLSFQATTVGSVTVGTSGVTVTPTGTYPTRASTCNFGSPSCVFATADSGLLFDVPDQRADAVVGFSITAVKKSDSSAACVPAFASVSKPVTFRCGYTNPSSGTLPVRVGGTALNAAGNAGTACDAGGKAVTLSFDSTGKAQTNVQYADVGQVTLAATYTGSGNDAGLVMTGTDTFISSPLWFGVSATSGTRVAGVAFGVTVTGRNYSAGITPNFGRENTPESVVLSFVRTQPTGSGAVSGTFSGSVGAFSGGTATSTNLVWTEVGRGEVAAVLASGSYLGTGAHASGSTVGGGIGCASQGGTCALPAGATAAVYYGGGGFFNMLTGLSGNVACNNATFGDPYPGYGAKGCNYVVTSGTSSTSGAVGPFKPHHFDVGVSPACGAFTYAGQPFSANLTARNAAGATTLNYDGSAATSPTYAKATTLSDAPTLGVGSLSGASVAAAAFTAGYASASPTYTYSAKLTGPTSLVLRAVDTDAVSSAGYAEGSTALRSGRLRLINGFGAETQALQLAVVADYWSGNAWVPNSADSCTSIGSASVAQSNRRDRSGNATSAWSTTASGLSLSGGQGTLTLTAPGAGNTGTIDLSLNLGTSAADQSCAAAHPSTTGGARAWLRSFNGACAATADRDPTARASFGIYSAETKKTVHAREVY